MKRVVWTGLATMLCGVLTVSGETNQGPRGQIALGGQAQLEGRVERLQTRSINQQSTLIAQVRTQDNRTVPVILGPRNRLGDLDLQQGDRVTIIGQRVRLNRQPALRAQRIRMDGQRPQADRPDRRQPQRRQPTDPYRQDPQFQQRQSLQGPMRPQQSPRQRRLQVSGTIEEFKQVKIYGQDEYHIVAAVSTEQGPTRVIDLGPRSQFEQLGIQAGDRIQVRGVQGSINNNPVVVARQVQAGGRQISISRTWNRRDFRLRGRLTNLRTITLGADDQPHLLAALQTEQGRQVLVDLGRRSILSEQNIVPSRGQRITLIVEPMQFNGRQILRARKISTANQMLQRTI